jgi:hypothetical protein
MPLARRMFVGAAAVVLLASCSGQGAPAAKTAQDGDAAAGGRIVVTAAQAPWRLPAPLSRMVVVPDGNGVRVAGGLTAADASATAVYRLDVGSGAAHRVGALSQPVHDAAGASIAGGLFVFGGGATSPTAPVQRVDGTGAGRIAGRLPQPRADLAAVTVGGQVYLLGGYTGTQPLAEVLDTTDGTTFHPVASLPVPVRYPAVAAVGTTIWVFGGEQPAGPVRAIQRIDTTTGRAQVVGQLPDPLSQASALVLDGQVLIAGGRTSSTTTSSAVYRFDPGQDTVHPVAELPVPVADAGGVVVGHTGYLLGGEDDGRVADVQTLTVATAPPSPAPSPSGGASAGARQLSDTHPFDGSLLIADRGNNRLLLVDADKRLLWTFPNAQAPAPPTGFYFPDDAFFIHHGTGIISNQEGNNTIVEIAFPSGTPLWSYGHTKIAKAAPGYLHEPDDAYLLANGDVTVADANNCRIVLISPQAEQIGQIGTPGSCVHRPPASLGYPNGDTPLADGNLLVSEVQGSWISEYTPAGQLVWAVQLPAIGYVSDPQQIGPDRYLVADYSKPGGLYQFDRAGHILWSYHPSAGPGMLDHPSLAEILPGGYLATNDDYRHRVVIINPRTNQIIWQYGHTDHPGTGPGSLNTPDGFDLLAPDNTTPTHPNTG